MTNIDNYPEINPEEEYGFKSSKKQVFPKLQNEVYYQ